MRGYILLEAMVGGAVTFAALLGLFVQLGFAREQSIVLHREVTAREIAVREMENLRATGFSGIGGGCPSSVGGGPVSTSSFNVVPGLVGRYEISTTRQCFREVVTTSEALGVFYRALTVNVRFPTTLSSGQRQVTVSTRIYDR